MTFYERYEKLAIDSGLKPISEEAAQRIGTSKAAISIWKKTGSVPLAKTVKRIADTFNVSQEYLMGLEERPQTENIATHIINDPLYEEVLKLDDIDRIKVQAYIQGLLANK